MPPSRPTEARRPLHAALLSLPLLAALSAPALGAVFQYRLTVETERGPREAFLWIPPKVRKVQGVVMGGMTLMEREFAKDAAIREACAAEGLAIVFLRSGLSRIDPGRLLAQFAEASGYDELRVAPLVFVGHSAGGPQAKARAIEYAGRCFGLVQYRGGAPGGDPALPPHVPSLTMLGQFDEFGGTMRDEDGRETWENGRDALSSYRKEHPESLASLVVEPGAGHFAWSRRNAEYLALYIRKAARACIPAGWPRDADEPVRTTSPKPREGWLTRLDIESAGSQEPVAGEEYSGEMSRVAWHFDRELARATLAYHAGALDKRDQFVKWEDPHWVDAGARFFFTKIEWVGNGRTFEVHPVYRETYPSQYDGRGPRWPEAGEPVGHADAPIRVRSVSGPVVAAGDHELRMRYDNLDPATGGGRATFLAYSEGDATYRYTEQVGMLPRGFRGLKKGKPQTLEFPEVADLPADSDPVTLEATSSAGLPVQYYVAYGPARVKDGRLTVEQVPKRAVFPLEVRVVAWQFGSGVEPRVQTAEPVSRTFEIREPR